MPPEPFQKLVRVDTRFGEVLSEGHAGHNPTISHNIQFLPTNSLKAADGGSRSNRSTSIHGLLGSGNTLTSALLPELLTLMVAGGLPIAVKGS